MSSRFISLWKAASFVQNPKWIGTIPISQYDSLFIVIPQSNIAIKQERTLADYYVYKIIKGCVLLLQVLDASQFGKQSSL